MSQNQQFEHARQEPARVEHQEPGGGGGNNDDLLSQVRNFGEVARQAADGIRDVSAEDELERIRNGPGQ